jgi:hypothetical protein
MADSDRRGTVFLVEEDAGDGSGDRAWCGYWDAPADGRGFLEDAGRHPSLDSALAWARGRSARVLVRYQDTDVYLWAGEGAPPPGVLPLDPGSDHS